MDPQLQPMLERGLKALGLALTPQQVDRLMAYLGLLVKWNRAYNLTAVRDPAEMVSRHLLDSLSVLPYIHADRVIDVGSGPGLPGIPLAICLPETQFTLLDSNGKKSRFQTQARMELGLENIQVVNSRVEAYQPDKTYPQVISRAFSALQEMVDWCDHLCTPDGEFLAMKGLYPESEVSSLPPGFQVTERFALQVPGTEGERHLLIVRRDA